MRIYTRMWIEKDGKTFLGSGRAEILQLIRDKGSIAKAAKEMRMSYKAAWDSVDIMNKLAAPDSLVVSLAGGGKNSGTKLTQLGEDALRVFHKLEAIRNELFDRIDSEDLAQLEEQLDKIAERIKA